MIEAIVTVFITGIIGFALGSSKDFVRLWRHAEEEESIKNKPKYYLILRYQGVVGKDRKDWSWLLFLHPYDQEEGQANTAIVARGDGIDEANKAVKEFCGYVHYAGEKE